MNIVLVIVLIVLGLLVIWQWRGAQQARAMQGQPAPDTRKVDKAITSPKKVYFFHAAGCRPCQQIMPMVERVRRNNPNLIPLEVSEHIQLARQFRLAGTPSFFAVNNGVIEEVKLGATDEAWLLRHLTDEQEAA